jgi:hypothetical protein
MFADGNRMSDRLLSQILRVVADSVNEDSHSNDWHLGI